MATLQLKKIAESLAKAQGVGQVEDDATIAGCHVVFRSLRPDEYEQIHADTAEKEDLAYLNAYRIEHLARSIVELGGQDFRSVEAVEVDGPDDKPIAIEKHEFLRDYVLSTWGREAVDVAFRKFNDVVQKADRTSADGVKFETPDETAEEKYRRLLVELRDVEGELPMDLALRLLEEAGYTKRVTTQDFEAAQERLRNMAPSETTTEETSEEPPPPAPEPVAPPPPRPQTMRASPAPASPSGRPTPVHVPPSSPVPAMATSRPASVEDLMRIRKPVHGQPATPVPTTTPSQAPQPMTRSQQIAAMEAVEDPALAVQATTQVAEPPPYEVEPVIEQPQTKLDPKAAAAILDRPPVGGVNRRFRPPPK